MENCASAAAILESQRAVEESKKLRAALAAADEDVFRGSDSDSDLEDIAQYTKSAPSILAPDTAVDDFHMESESHATTALHIEELESMVGDRFEFLTTKTMEVMKSIKTCNIKAVEAQRRAHESDRQVVQLKRTVESLNAQLSESRTMMAEMRAHIRTLEDLLQQRMQQQVRVKESKRARERARERESESERERERARVSVGQRTDKIGWRFACKGCINKFGRHCNDYHYEHKYIYKLGRAYTCSSVGYKRSTTMSSTAQHSTR
jgi:chromosome segregation ATPase